MSLFTVQTLSVTCTSYGPDCRFTNAERAVPKSADTLLGREMNFSMSESYFHSQLSGCLTFGRHHYCCHIHHIMYLSPSSLTVLPVQHPTIWHDCKYKFPWDGVNCLYDKTERNITDTFLPHLHTVSLFTVQTLSVTLIKVVASHFKQYC